MSDQLRLVDEGSAAECELILAARAAGMSPEDRARIWTAVAAGCVAGGAAMVGATVGAKAGMLATITSWKGVAVLLLVGGGSLATYQLTRSPPLPPKPLVAPQVLRPPFEPPTAPPRPADPGAEPVAPAAPALPRPVGANRPSKPPSAGTVKEPARPAEGPHASDSSHLAEESRMVIEARRALHAGDFATTLHLLESAAATFPNGALGQEREALAIQALARSGQRAAAAKRAAAFLAEYPNSPHAADLKAFTR
jgi:hypothetical protein